MLRVRAPEVPVNWTVALVRGALEAAVRVNDCCVPGCMAAVVGATVTPLGSPLTVTLMVEAKPLMAVVDTITGAEFPTARLKLDGLAVSPKSATGAGGGGGGGFDVLPPPPHPFCRRKKLARTAAKHNKRRGCLRIQRETWLSMPVVDVGSETSENGRPTIDPG